MKAAPPNKNTSKKSPVKAKATVSKSKSDGNKKSAQDTIFELVAESHGLRNDSLARDQLSKGTGIAAKTVANNLIKLKQKGLVEYDATTVHLTSKGIEKAGPLASGPTSNEEIHERLKKGLKGKQVKLFDLLADGGIHDRNVFAVELDFEDAKKKGFKNLCSALSGKGLVEYPDKQTMTLTDTCFPLGRGVCDV